MAGGRFAERFTALTERAPFPWQSALFERLAFGETPARCDIPTGLGKTSVLALWLLALAEQVELGAPALPRRLVYVVNRRTVVDQATREAESLCAASKLREPRLADVWASLRSIRIQDARGLEHLDPPLAISTLRGQFADNGSWRADPSRPSIIIGTVDMIGSRLLFSGYGRGFKTRPLHAGFLGQGALLVHDEAHLEPAFQGLLEEVEREQHRFAGSRRDGFGRLQVVALTATSRGGRGSSSRAPLALSAADREHAVVRERIFAKKRVAFYPCDEKKVADRIAELALTHAQSDGAILIFVRKVEDVQKVTRKLPKDAWTTLTGTIRGLERDLLKDHAVFARFDPKSQLEPAAKRAGTVYLVCTSAGEVGVDISADHLLCNLTPFDSMAQRFGRVNRFGFADGRVARIDVVHADEVAREATPFDAACARTLTLLTTLPVIEGRHDASPAALGELPEEERSEAFTPLPEIPAVTEVLFDAWALTSITDALPGRPPVADWLHGVAEWEPPETHVAWREEVEPGRVPNSLSPREVLEVYPLKPHELLRDASSRVLREIKAIAERSPELPVWVRGADETEVTTIGMLSNGLIDSIADSTLILPPSAGGLTMSGALDGKEGAQAEVQHDVADRWLDENGQPRRVRIEVGEDGESDSQKKQHRGMRLVLSLGSGEDDTAENGAATSRGWRWYVEPVSMDDQGSRTAPRMQTLGFHLASAQHFAREIVRALGLDEPEASAIIWAARFHDLGKDRRLWQRSIGNFDTNTTLAKSEIGRGRRSLTKYRHELGSLFDLEQELDFKLLGDDAKELVRHVIAAHHGRGRPGFSQDEVFDPNHSDGACREVAREVPRRFARLQRTYGRWGLAYLESLLRAADVLASIAVEASSAHAPIESAAAE